MLLQQRVLFKETDARALQSHFLKNRAFLQDFFFFYNEGVIKTPQIMLSFKLKQKNLPTIGRIA